MSYGQVIDFLERHLLPCSIRELTGQVCPGCGMQSALVALLRGELSASLQANPALLPYLFTLGYAALHLRLGFTNGPRNIVIFFCSATALMIVNYIARVTHFW